MIPKVIHYCWFGGNPLPKLVQKCLASWKKFCPDYEIVRWDESNFDVNGCDYSREAYEAKKWAFVSDYARLKVIVDNGGIYMDTDVEVVKPLDRFLIHEAFSGFDTTGLIPAGTMACEKGFALFAEMLKVYDTRHFLLKGGGYDMTTNISIMTRYFSQYGLIFNNTKQTIKGLTLYPKDYFCPKNLRTHEIESTPNTYTIHHFDSSWAPLSIKFKKIIKEIIGVKMTKRIIRFKQLVLKKSRH